MFLFPTATAAGPAKEGAAAAEGKEGGLDAVGVPTQLHGYER